MFKEEEITACYVVNMIRVNKTTANPQAQMTAQKQLLRSFCFFALNSICDPIGCSMDCGPDSLENARRFLKTSAVESHGYR